MSAPYACFQKIIGLADTSCECFTDDFDADDAESASGLQLVDQEGLSLDIIKAALSCAGGTLPEFLSKARAEGVKRWKSEVLRFIQTNTRWKRPPVVGPKRPTIGDHKNSRKEITMGSTFHGMSLELAHHVGGKATLKRIGTYFTTTGTIDLDIYGIDDDTPLDTVTLDTEANKLKWNTVEMDLPMEVEGSKNPRYWFLYEPGAMVALNSRMHCGCGGGNGPRDISLINESRVKDDGQAWRVWVRRAGGTKGEDVTEREDWSLSNETQGIILDIEFTCETIRSICDGNPDYENDQIQMSSAWGVRYAAASWIVSWLTNSPKVNRETLTGNEENYFRTKAIFEKGFREHAIDYVGKSLIQSPGDHPASGVNTYSDCFTCKNHSGMKVSTIKR